MGKWKALRLKVGAPLELYDLDADVGETRDVAALHPDVVARVEELPEGRHGRSRHGGRQWLRPLATTQRTHRAGAGAFPYTCVA